MSYVFGDISFLFIFHPLFIPVYVIWFLTFIQPYAFSGIRTNSSFLVIARSALIYTFFPAVIILLLKGVGFINSVFLKTQKDRIIPYVAVMVCYFWAWNVNRNLANTLPLLISFSFAIFLASCFGLMANIYMKVSMHALAAGVMLAFMVFFIFSESINLSLYLTGAILITGIVCTSRMIVSNHTPKEIYAGLALGILAQVIALLFT
ncbi:MAG: hypothetical protein HC867_09865 [Bacteroidia bacterium]|nr:hypothetical protein [Bacteroidia bacterium]